MIVCKEYNNGDHSLVLNELQIGFELIVTLKDDVKLFEFDERNYVDALNTFNKYKMSIEGEI